MRRGQSLAFTLVELLVVIAVIALLIAILLPVLASARSAGRVAVCLSNLRQQGIAMGSYQVNEQGHYPFGDKMGFDTNGNYQPRGHRWYIALGPYLHGDPMPDSSLASMHFPPLAGRNYSWDYQARGRQLVPATNGIYATREVSAFGTINAYTCPETKGFVMFTTVQPGPFHGAWDVDYRINGSVTGFSNGATNPNTWCYPPIRNIKQPSAAWALMDGDSWASQQGYWSYGHWALGVGCEVTGGVLPTGTTFANAMHNTRHAAGGETANLSFFDGHAEAGWSFERIAAVSYGPDFAARNAWWRGDPRSYAVAQAIPY